MKNVWLVLVMSSAVALVAGLWVPLKAMAAQELLTLAWSRTEASQSASRPWPWADTWPVARLELPGQGRPLVVLAGGHGESLAFGPGQLVGPGVGEIPVQAASLPTVIAGHRDTHFHPLQHLQSRDLIRLQLADGVWRQFRVDAVRIVDSRTQPLELTRFQPGALVLVTCYPFDSVDPGGPLRLVVEASRVAA